LNDLTLNNDHLIIVALAAILCLLSGKSRLRGMGIAAAWIASCSLLMLNSFIRIVYDDEVYYLAQAVTAARGEIHGCLPMRIWIYRPFLWLHISTSWTIVITRAATVAAALSAAVVLIRTAALMNVPRPTSLLSGAVLILAFAYLPMGTLVPEYAAYLCLILGIFSLIRGLDQRSRSAPFAWSGFMLGLAGLTSLRMLPLAAAGIAASWLCQEKPRSNRPPLIAIAGGILAAIPTLIYIGLYDSFASLFFWNYALFRKIGVIKFSSPASLPGVLAGIAAAGVLLLWTKPGLSQKHRALLLLWLTATVSAIWNPQKLEHTLAAWLTISCLLSAAALEEIKQRIGGSAGQRTYLFLAGLLIFSILMPQIPVSIAPENIKFEFRNMRSGLELVDWLRETANGEPVACVPPFHPIFSRNTWNLWNVIFYCYVNDPAMIREISPDLVGKLESGQAAIIEWDPWPTESNCANVLQFLVNRKFLDRPGAEKLGEKLRDRYELVQWQRPVEGDFGSGKFLVRKGIPLRGPIVQLSPELITCP
jgi:hypothetical protein